MPEVMHDGAPAPPVRVAPAALQRSGRELQRIAAALASDAAAEQAVLTAAAGTGWAAEGAAVDAAREWLAWLRECGGQLDGLGDRSAAAAEAYLHCDVRAATRASEAVPR